MYSSLRPELRGAQRILRSTRPLRTRNPHYSYQPHRVQTVRSFASFSRLREQTPQPPSPPKPPAKPETPLGPLGPDKAPDHAEKVASILRWATQGSPNAVIQTPTTPLPGDLDEKASKIFTALEQNLIPDGYALAQSADDLPQDIAEIKEKEYAAWPFPLLYTRDVSSDFVILPPPGQNANVVGEEHDQQGTSSNTADSSSNVEHAGKTSSRDWRGLYRDRRSRQKRLLRELSDEDLIQAVNGNLRPKSPEPKATLPSWFSTNNIAEYREGSKNIPLVIPVKQSADGTYSSTYAGSGQNDLQLLSPEAHKGQNLGPDGGDSIPQDNSISSSPAPHNPEEATQGQVSVGNGKYFIESAQYNELLNTFKGRVRGRNGTSTKHGIFSEDVGHLTILHTSPDTDLLLDALVRDLCHEAEADYVRLDIQDISVLGANSKLAPNLRNDLSRLSFKVYRDIYGSQSLYHESNMPREEDDEDIDEDEDEEHNMFGRTSFDIPISSVVALPAGSKPGDPSFNRATRDAISNLIGKVQNASPFTQQSGNGGILIDAEGANTLKNQLINPIVTATRPSKKSSKNDTKDAQQNASTRTSTPKPLIIHIPTYKALQNHRLAETFMGELITAADEQTRNGNPVMVVGTDWMRDFSTAHNPRAILEEQDHLSYGASTAIILTSVFPTREAELALTKDRENRIRDINVRHLYQTLKDRGIALKGFDEGFWLRDYSAELGETDCRALSGAYWPFYHVQRIATIIGGNDLSQTPVTDASNTILQSDESKVSWARRTQPDIIKHENNDPDKSEAKNIRQIRSKATKHEKKLLSGVVEPKKINTTFSDIHIPVETVEALQTLTTLSLVRPEAFKYGVLKSDRIPGLLLYGPPGTGKTLAAKAVAKESGATMLEVSAADLNDMYVGEGEKNVQALFSLAKKLSPCVVFLDEADAMFSARSAAGRRVSHRELLNQFLKEWDGMSNDSGSAFIMVATNRPMDLDDAVLRRLPRRLLVDLPTEQDRLEILKIHLRQEHLGQDVDLPDLAKLTPFYSGSDLKNVAVAAALNAVHEENEAAKKYRTENPDSETPYEYPEKRTLNKSHFEKALEEISASISQDMSSLRDIKKFDEQYGDRKGRKRKTPKWGFRSASEADKVLDTVKVRS